MIGKTNFLDLIFLLLTALFFSCQSSTMPADISSFSISASSIPVEPPVFNSLPVEVEKQKIEGSPIYVSADQGRTWVAHASGLPDQLQINRFAKLGNELFIGTEANGLFKSSNGQNNWQAIGQSLPGKKIISLQAGEKNLYAGIFDEGIFKSIDGGATWEAISYNLQNLRVRAILEFNDQLFIGTDTGIYEYSESTKYWSPKIVPGQINSLDINDGKIIAATYKGTLLSEDLGANWHWIHESGTSQKSIIAKGLIIERIMDGGLYFSRDWGKSWIEPIQFRGKGAPVYDIIPLQRKLFMINGWGILESLDDGLNWELIFPTQDRVLQRLFSDEELMYAVSWGMTGC